VPFIVSQNESQVVSASVTDQNTGTTKTRTSRRMNIENSVEMPVSKYRPLRIWIPVLLLGLMVVARNFSRLFPEMPQVWMAVAFGPALAGILVLVWWLACSRATWKERVLGFIVVAGGIAAAIFLLDKSMIGPPAIVLTVPSTLAAFAVVLILLSRKLTFGRTTIAVLVSLIVAGFSTLLKNEGAAGDFSFGYKWRWSPSSEDTFLASRQTQAASSGAEADDIRRPTADSFNEPQWPGFRGLERDGIQRGQTFAKDWTANPPVEKWRIAVGPAWSSFAVADSFLVTQEQRGEQEAVVCYDGETGREVWANDTQSRFFDALGGLGPRATPTIDKGNVYAMGAAGWLVKLSGNDGKLIWKKNLSEITGQQPPMWGYSCSPLVHEDLVIVHAAGNDEKGILAFDTESGDMRWSVAANKDSYSSLHLTRFFGDQQLVFLGSDGAVFLNPKTGETLMKHEFEIQGYRALQPAVVDDDRLFFTNESEGSRLIRLNKTESGLESTEEWTSRDIKPDFNDFAIHKGHIYGFDGPMFVCVNLEDGKRTWKKGRYGKGQMILLADSDLILVISEKEGELVLLDADPSQHREVFKMKALEGKTWNHPVVVGDRLYLRNAAEAVCYELPK
jgi:outer membrane protein assembly factor BamB